MMWNLPIIMTIITNMTVAYRIAIFGDINQ